MPIEIFHVKRAKPEVNFSELLGKSISHIATSVGGSVKKPAAESQPPPMRIPLE